MVLKQLALALTALFAACAPLLFRGLEFKGIEFIALSANSQHSAQTNHQQTSVWPTHYEGKALFELPLTVKEQLFIQGFPGQIKRFSDGHRELIIRKVMQPTRMLHPAIDCFKGIGYQITPLPIQINSLGIKMGCFRATKDKQKLKVCEYISASDGQSWSDVSSWYWHTFMNSEVVSEQHQGWLSVVVAQSD